MMAEIITIILSVILTFKIFLESRNIKKRLPIKVGTSQREIALQIPKVVVIPLPPLNFKNGVNICPKTGAIDINTKDMEERLKELIIKETGTAPFRKSKMRDGIPITRPPALKLFAAPGLRSSP